MKNNEQLAQALGWFSIGLGLAEALAPSGLAKAIGIRDDADNQRILRLAGMREIATGLTILMQDSPVAGIRARVAGDAMDAALLGMAFNAPDTDRVKLATATAAVMGVVALDLLCHEHLSHLAQNSAQQEAQSFTPQAPGQKMTEQRLTEQKTMGRLREKKGMDVKQTITIDRSPEELYNFWRDFENLARFMNHLESVQVMGDGRSHWKAKAPAGKTVEWDAEIVDDQPNRRIAWRSLEGADVANAGSVRFERATGGRGTVVRVEMQYSPPGGVVGAGIAKLFGEEPEQQVWEDLHRFKQVMETGEVLLSEGTPDGMGTAQRSAQQSESAVKA